MKHIMEFNMPEDAKDLEIHLQATNTHILLHEVEQMIFRPARKYGYGSLSESANSRLNKLLENPDVVKAICILEEEYYKLKNSLNISTQ